jgi:hypothetical protein
MGQVCPNCGQGKLEPQPARLRNEPPELLIPFARRSADLRSIFASFVKPVWLRSYDLSAEGLARRAVPVFWPMWLVDCNISGNWQAEMGYDYQVKSSQESYSGRDWQTQERIETRVRWEPRLGQLSRHYDNIAAPAASDHNQLARLVGSYQAQASIPYVSEQIEGASIRIPDLHPENTWSMAQSALDQAAANECQQASEAQHVRNFTIQAQYDNLNWTQLLQPMYVSYYIADDGQPRLVFVNGQTGVTGGVRLASQRKGCLWASLGGAAAMALFVLYVLLVVAGTAIPALGNLAVLVILAALAVGVFSIVPAVWPWQWNRKQQEQRVTRG